MKELLIIAGMFFGIEAVVVSFEIVSQSHHSDFSIQKVVAFILRCPSYN